MTRQAILDSDMRQSISDADVIDDAKREQPYGLVAGLKCGNEPSHGRMLMSAKSGMLECGPCGYQAIAPTE